MKNKFFSEEEIRRIVTAIPDGVKLVNYKFKTEDGLRRELDEIYRGRFGKWGKYGFDGFITEWQATYRYRGIEYVIKSLKYFSFRYEDPFDAGLNHIGRHLVLKYTENSREIHDFIYKVFYKVILYYDTLRSGMENWDIEKMINYLHETAKKDIDWFLDKSIKELEEKINKLKNLHRKYRAEVREDG